MNRKNKIFFLRGVLFLLLLCITLVPVTCVFSRKSLSAPWDMTNKVGGFYNEPEDEFEVMFFGSSHAYASFSPVELWHKTGVKSYVFATQQQPLWATYTYIEEALKTQSPSLIVVECNMAANDAEYMDDGVNFSFMDELPLSMEKIRLAQISAPEGERLPLIWNFMKYHSRWSELHRSDFTTVRSQLSDPYRGFVLLPYMNESYFMIDAWRIHDPLPISEKNELYLQKIIDLCKERDVELWLCKAPSNPTPEDQMKMLRVAEIAAENDVPFDDFNLKYDELGISEDVDFHDDHHLHGASAARFTDRFAEIMCERYPTLATDPDNEDWKQDYAAYAQELTRLFTPEQLGSACPPPTETEEN